VIIAPSSHITWIVPTENQGRLSQIGIWWSPLIYSSGPQLIPTLRIDTLNKQEYIDQYGTRLVEECRQALSVVLPFSEAEKAFLDLLLDHGEIDSTLLTADKDLQQRIQKQPLLEWKAVNVRKFKGL
jgi:hypothetical protein